MAVATDLDWHLGVITQRLLLGKVVPFLGAGANLCGRTPVVPWQPVAGLPSGSELADYLIHRLSTDPASGYPADESRDLVRVSQFVSAVLGLPALHEHLHEVFDQVYPPTAVHQFLARLPVLMATAAAADGRGTEADKPLIVTTNYDDALEQAFDEAGEPYDLVAYIAAGRHAGRFIHRRPDGTTRVITSPNRYRELSLRDHTLILKLHGAVDRSDATHDSYVITEDDYIDFLARPESIPAQVLAKMRQSHFLFLGYGLRDWNLRVILHRLWGQERLAYGSWSVQVDPSRIDRKVWQDREVEIFDVDLATYVTALAGRLTAAGQAASP